MKSTKQLISSAIINEAYKYITINPIENLYSEKDIIHFVRGFHSVIYESVSMEKTGFFKAASNVDKSYTQLVAGLISTLKIREEA